MFMIINYCNINFNIDAILVQLLTVFNQFICRGSNLQLNE